MLKALVCLCLLIIILGIPRGFDFSDEGLYVLLADPRQANLGGIFNYDLFFKLFYQFTGLEFGIIGLRIIRLLSYFVGAIALAFFWKNLFGKPKIQVSVFLLGLAGLFGGYAFLPPTLSYNSISVVAVCLWLALISKEKLNSIHWLLLGMIFLILFYSKITVCLLIGLLSLIYLGFEKKLTIRNFLLLISPGIIFEGLFFLIFKENAMTRLVSENGFIFQRNDYSLLHLFKYTLVGLFWILLSSLTFYLFGRLRAFSKFIRLFILGVAGFFLISVFYLTFVTSEWNHIFLLAMFAAICWQLGMINPSDYYNKKGLFLLILLALPFIIHFGSNVYWMRIGIHYWVFWIFAFAIIIEQYSERFQKFFQFSVASITLIILINGLWIAPFEGENLWNSNVPFAYGPDKSILLKQEEVQFLNKLAIEIERKNPQTIVALYRNPGLLYMLGKNPLYSPGYWMPSQAKTYLESGKTVDLILFNNQEEFPFDRANWSTVAELPQPNGDKLVLLWRN